MPTEQTTSVGKEMVLSWVFEKLCEVHLKMLKNSKISILMEIYIYFEKYILREELSYNFFK